MSFTVPNTFTTGTTLEAEELTENEDAAYQFLNADILETDIGGGSVDTSDIAKGEDVDPTDDILFQSGDVYSYRLALTRDITPSEKRYHTATIKSYDPQVGTRYVSVPDLGKEIYLEDYANVIFRCSFFTVEADNSSTRAVVNRGSVGSSNSVDSPFYLSIDGQVELDSVAYAFEENGSGTTTETPTSQSVAAGMDVCGGAQHRKFVHIYWMAPDLSPGYHRLQVVVNPNNEKGYVGQRMMTIEVFYVGGYTPASNLRNASFRKLPETIY